VEGGYCGRMLQGEDVSVEGGYSGRMLQWEDATVEGGYSGRKLQWKDATVEGRYSGRTLPQILHSINKLGSVAETNVFPVKYELDFYPRRRHSS
jgi:hypothetical protein